MILYQRSTLDTVVPEVGEFLTKITATYDDRSVLKLYFDLCFVQIRKKLL